MKLYKNDEIDRLIKNPTTVHTSLKTFFFFYLHIFLYLHLTRPFSFLINNLRVINYKNKMNLLCRNYQFRNVIDKCYRQVRSFHHFPV